MVKTLRKFFLTFEIQSPFFCLSTFKRTETTSSKLIRFNSTMEIKLEINNRFRLPPGSSALLCGRPGRWGTRGWGWRRRTKVHSTRLTAAVFVGGAMNHRQVPDYPLLEMAASDMYYWKGRFWFSPCVSWLQQNHKVWILRHIWPLKHMWPPGFQIRDMVLHFFHDLPVLLWDTKCKTV